MRSKTAREILTKFCRLEHHFQLISIVFPLAKRYMVKPIGFVFFLPLGGGAGCDAGAACMAGAGLGFKCILLCLQIRNYSTQ